VILSTYSGEELGKSWGNKVSVRPLRLRKRYGETALSVLAHQVLVLSRIHGASLYRHPRLPVTTHHADRFATLRQEACIDALSKMDRLCPVYL
jgi:argonaute-like protein implicated in RNA metabolism and viral defense